MRHRLSIAFGITLLTALLLPYNWRLPVRSIVAWNFGVIVFLSLAVLMMNQATERVMRYRATVDNESRWRILAGVTIGIGVSLLTIVSMLKDAKQLAPGLLTLHVGLAVLTVVCAWLLMHTMFALHYAHDYYVSLIRDPDAPTCLRFPTETQPDYWDFVYFSFVIGMTSQVADVEISSRKFRQLCLIHGILSFFFNTAIVAMSINLIAGLI